MKFSATSSELLLALLKVSGSIQPNKMSPILNNVCLVLSDDKLELRATDMQSEAVSVIDVVTDFEGATTVDCKKLTQIIKALGKKSAVNFQLVNNELLITSGRSKFTLKSLPVNDYPSLETATYPHEITIIERDFVSLLGSVSYSMAQNDVRYYLNSMYLTHDNGLKAVATDGHRMALNSLESEVEQFKGVIVPNKSVDELIKLLDSKNDESITLKLSDRHLQVNKGNTSFTTKLIDGKYPDYKAAIPKEINHNVLIDRLDLLNALNSVVVLSNEKFKGCRLVFTDNTLTLSANNPEQEEATVIIDCNYSGDMFEIGFNIKYVIDAISNLDSEFINFGLTTTGSSSLVTTENSSVQSILMPIKL